MHDNLSYTTFSFRRNGPRTSLRDGVWDRVEEGRSHGNVKNAPHRGPGQHALVLVAGPVVGHKGEGDTHRGKVGRHAFRDSDLKPGARCIYREVAPAPAADESDAAMELVGVSVRAPKVAAINRTRRIDRQPVAWRFILQEKTDDEDWTKVRRSRTQVRRANDRSAARLNRLAIRYDGNPEADYRVVSKAYWLKKRNPLKKVGAATHLVDHYRVGGVVTGASCSGDGSVPVSETS